MQFKQNQIFFIKSSHGTKHGYFSMAQDRMAEQIIEDGEFSQNKKKRE
jgi:hypothetical protein